MPHARLRFTLPLVALLLGFAPANAQTVRRTLAPGIEFTQESTAPPAGPLLINILKVDLKRPGVRVQAELGQDVVLSDDPTTGRETVAVTAERHNAVAAVNADYFPYTGDPLNLMVRDGELLSESMPHRVAMAITNDGQVRFDTLLTVGSVMGSDGTIYGLDGINRLPGRDEIVVLTPSFGPRSRAIAASAAVTLAGVNLPVRIGQEQSGAAGEILRGDPRAAIPAGGAILVGVGRGAEWLRLHVRSGESVRFRFDCVSNPLPSGPYRVELASRAASFRGRAIKSVWTDVRQAVGGGPWLVRDGKPAIDGQAENWSESDFVARRHPRTAVGVTSAGELLLVTVDGRQDALSRGMSLPELADTMIRLGAAQAINLDGGGSTAMAVRGAYVSSPSDGVPRPVACSLLVFAAENGRTAIETRDPITIQAGTRTTLAASLGEAAAGTDGTPGIWGSVEGKAFVTQSGTLSATRAGTGTAAFTLEGRTVKIPYTVLPGPPVRVRASLGAVANNPPDRSMLTAMVADAYGNPIPNQPVRIQVSGGAADMTEAVTDAAGRVSVEVVWEVERGRKITVTSGGLPPAILTPK